MPRQVSPELMDQPDVDPASLEAALAHLRWINRRLGGARALIRHLDAWSRSWPKDRPITLLDVGTGCADIPLQARAWARSRGFDLRVTALDAHPLTLAIARRHAANDPGIELVHADARNLRDLFHAGQFDYAHAGLFIHHLRELDVLTVLSAMNRVARRGVVWSDLVRSPLRRLMVSLATLPAPPIVREDARLSVLAGFTRREAQDIARRVDLDYTRWHCPFLWYRFTMAGEKPDAWR